MFSYSVYGLTLASSLCLPELAEGIGAPDVVVATAVASPATPRARGDAAGAEVAGGVRLEYPGIATLTVAEGRRIAVAAAADADPDTVRMLVLGPALGVLLHQRGVLALHASSVLLDRGVAAFLGASGAGKSTMAAALQQRGHALVADDITAVVPEAAGPGVLAAFPRLKLFPEAAAALGLDVDALPQVSAADSRRAQRAPDRLPGERLPLAAIFVLADGEAASIEPLAPTDALLDLVRHSYCAPRLAELGTRGHFLQCAEIARSVPVYRLVRPRELARLHELAALVEREAGGGR